MPCLGAQPRHIGLCIVPTHTDDGVSSGLGKAWRMPIAARSNEAGPGRINRSAAIGVRPICLSHKLSVLISRHVKFANCKLVSDRDQMLRYRVSATFIRPILALFFPRRCPHSEPALLHHYHFGAT